MEDPPEPIDNRAPIAVSSPGSDYPIGSTVTLSAVESFDPDGDPLLYHWSANVPGISGPVVGEDSEFTLDLQNEGPHLVDLTVEDPFGATSSTSVRVGAIIPEAVTEVNTGPNGEVPIYQQVDILGSIELFGALETSFSWRLLRKPQQSTAQLTDTDTLSPSFLADRVGDYMIELSVESLGSTYKSRISLIATASQLAPGSRFVSFDYSPTAGKFAATSGTAGGKLQIWNPITWSVIPIELSVPQTVAFTVDGSQLVTSLGFGSVFVVQIDTLSGSIINTTQVTFPGDFRPATNEQILSVSSESADTLNLVSEVVNSTSGTIGNNLLAATNLGNKFYAWETTNSGRVGRLAVTSTGPVFLGLHQLASGDCSPLWSSPTEQFVISACGKILRVSDDETLDLSEVGDLAVREIEAAVHATTLGLIIVATNEGSEFALRAFDDVTFEEEWVRVLPDWYTEESDLHPLALAPRALYVLPDGETLLMVGQRLSSFGQHYLLRFKL